MKGYMISIDQSTQGTKALLFDPAGKLICRRDKAHRQIVNERGWISHDPEEIYENVTEVIRKLLEDSGIEHKNIAGLAISNQRETSVIWDLDTGVALAPAVVWQCARAEEICQRAEIREYAEEIFRKTGLRLSPYFPAAKLAWLMEHTQGAAELAEKGKLGCGTMDSYLLYRLTKGKSYKTDYSNASRTQLFDIFSLQWDEKLCRLFGIRRECLPQVADSDALFGYTDCEGILAYPVPIHCILGDSHAALFGQHCVKRGMTKATYGTGSSIMMNIGEQVILSSRGLVTSLAWRRGGKTEYVLEGNLNYAGAVISWLQKELGLIQSPEETEQLARHAAKDDSLYLIPAFSGLGAPYWNSRVRAAFMGMDRTTGKAELVRAALECIAYQVRDVIAVMEEDAKLHPKEVKTDGGPTKNSYLMQFQSDILGTDVAVSETEELSGTGAGYMAGLALGIWEEESVFENIGRICYTPAMTHETRTRKVNGWRKSVEGLLMGLSEKKPDPEGTDETDKTAIL